MEEKRIPLVNDETKHKKKSTAKGLPRSKHKHQYETVLLSRFTHINLGVEEIHEHRIPTKVCTICGRIDYTDNSYYVTVPEYLNNGVVYRTKLSDDALCLPKWYSEGYFAKFATKGTSDIVPNKIY